MPGVDDVTDETVDVAVSVSALCPTDDVEISGIVLVVGVVTPPGSDDVLLVGDNTAPVTPPSTALITAVDDGVSAPCCGNVVAGTPPSALLDVGCGEDEALSDVETKASDVVGVVVTISGADTVEVGTVFSTAGKPKLEDGVEVPAPIPPSRPLHGPTPNVDDVEESSVELVVDVFTLPSTGTGAVVEGDPPSDVVATVEEFVAPSPSGAVVAGNVVVGCPPPVDVALSVTGGVELTTSVTVEVGTVLDGCV